MSADVASILTRLALIEAEILDPATGAAIKAYEEVPFTISSADMPLFINYAGPLIRNELVGSDELAREYQETRNYSLVLYHSNYGSGIEGEKFGLLAPYFELVYAKFGSYPRLNNIGAVVNAVLIADTGMGTVPFMGQAYNGIRFTLQVVSRVRRPFAQGE